jgi:Holliday junction DNA helicase RuvA
MIGHLRGTLLEKHPNEVIVEAQGVGYLVTIPVSTFSQLPDTGAEVKLRIHTHVREDAIALFGFVTLDEKFLFERLITVSGIGPKLAITVLSGLPVADLVSAIRSGNLPVLTRVPGIGKKTAERLVVELRDKLDSLGVKGVAATATAAAATALSAVDEDVLSALTNLGCPKPAAEAAIRKARAAGVAAEFEPLFRKALELVR